VIVCRRIAGKYRPKEYAVDGLNSLKYKLLDKESRLLYTWLHVQLPPQPANFTEKNPGLSTLLTLNSSTEHVKNATLSGTLDTF